MAESLWHKIGHELNKNVIMFQTWAECSYHSHMEFLQVPGNQSFTDEALRLSGNDQGQLVDDGLWLSEGVAECTHE